MGQFSDDERALFQCRGVEYREIAAVLGTAVDRRQQKAVALRRIRAARQKNRRRCSVARRQPVSCPRIGLEIDMRQRIEGVAAVATGGKEAVTIVKAGEALVEAREFTGKIVDPFLLE